MSFSLPDVQDGNSLKRMRMVAEGSQISQHSTAQAVANASNVAVVPAAQVVPCNKAQDTPVSESHLPVQNVPVDVKDVPVAVIASAQQPSTSTAVDGELMSTLWEQESYVFVGLLVLCFISLFILMKLMLDHMYFLMLLCWLKMKNFQRVNSKSIHLTFEVSVPIN